jgi:hypothetical protein
MSGAFFWWKDHQPVIARITELSGMVQWTGDGGQVIDDMAVGSPVRGGTRESLSADSWGTLEFLDGSVVTISGRSVLTISEREHKELRLRQGRLSARVQPQPAGKPMRLHTPTAELQVLGTQFNVDAGPVETVLHVNEGRVRLKRLSDGEVVEVPARHQALASLEDESGLTVTNRALATHSWRADLARDATHGKWISELQSLGAKLKKAVVNGKLTVEEAKAKYKAAASLNDEAGLLYAAPWLLKSSKAGSKADVSYLTVVSVTRGRTVPVVLQAGSRFRVQGRAALSGPVTFGMAANAPGGGFAGKYAAVCTIETSGPDGNFDIEIPLSEFQPVALKKMSEASPVGQELTDWWCRTTDQNAKLAIVHIELLALKEAQSE